MNRKAGSLYIIVLMIGTIQLRAQNTVPKVVSGKIERIEAFQSKYVTARNIDIWLPDGYPDSGSYAVLYMQDGQMLYDSEMSWNKQAWNIDDVATQLLASNKIKNFIVVGIWNDGLTRHQDYFPQKPFEEMTQTDKDTIIAQLQRAGRTKETFIPASDNYLNFIVEELKPFIDKKYKINTGRENTFIAGSSMGALISIYAICEHPEIFGGAACMSTHWTGIFTLDDNPFPAAILNYLNRKLPDPGNHKIYFDYGDQTLDALYPGIQMKVDSLMKSKKYTDIDWVSKYFPGKDHSENSWNERLNYPLEFLLGK
jgi:predicted alpha/beta superfamily hydrolase